MTTNTATDTATDTEVTEPAGETRSGPEPLRDFYENPAVPVASGPGRAQRQLRMIESVLARREERQVIIDIGCGDGEATSLLPRDRHTVVGVDWSMMALRHAKGLGLTVIRGGIDAPGLPIADGGADIVVLSEVIEHIVDTDSAIDEIHRVLKPGGTLLLSTPNLAAWFNRGLLAFGIQPIFSEVSLRGIYGRPGSQVVGHLHMFTKRALTEFLTDRGFHCERVAGAPYHDVPRPLRPLDRLMCHLPGAASILLVEARRT